MNAVQCIVQHMDRSKVLKTAREKSSGLETMINNTD